MVRFSKEVAHRVWAYLEDVIDLEIIFLIAPIDERTVERLRTVLNGLKAKKTNKELATPEWKEDTIAGLREWWEDYLRSKHKWSRERHLERLAESVTKLRSRIINPEIPRRLFGGKSAWFWSDYDWRLFPDIWFAVVCPYLVFLDAWIPNFNNLLSHLSDSGFLRHYKELREGCLELRNELNRQFEKLKKQDASRAINMDELDTALGILFVDNYVPDQPPTEEDIANLPDKKFCTETIEELRKLIPDLDKKYDKLEHKLQQMWDDLDPDPIDLIIENGKCSRCSYME